MLEKEYQYYQNNKESLLVEHKGKFAVISGEEILGFYESRGKALYEAMKDHELGTFFIQEIMEKDEVHKFTSRVG